MIILGLDPGIARTGFGVLDTSTPGLFITCGCLTTPAHTELAERLVTIGTDVQTLITQYRPDAAVVESVFFGKNAKTAMLTAQTRGVLLYVLQQAHIPITSLTPLQIKSRLTGYGAATKVQVQEIVTKRLKLTDVPQPDDAADALAAALAIS
jgi:crossover junction endodeoxyribonuclease RuvC